MLRALAVAALDPCLSLLVHWRPSLLPLALLLSVADLRYPLRRCQFKNKRPSPEIEGKKARKKALIPELSHALLPHTLILSHSPFSSLLSLLAHKVVPTRRVELHECIMHVEFSGGGKNDGDQELIRTWNIVVIPSPLPFWTTFQPKPKRLLSRERLALSNKLSSTQIN